MTPLWRAALLAPIVAVFSLFLLWPLVVLGLKSAPGGATGHYFEILRDPFYRGALAHSLGLSAAVASAATLASLLPAWLFAFHEFHGKSAMRAAFTLPMSLSGIMIGFFAIIMVGRIGIVPSLLFRLTGHAFLSGAAYQMTGLVLAYLYFEIPRGMLTLEASLRQFDRRIGAAARSLGANACQRFFWIILPLIWRPIVSTFGVTFSVSLGSFGAALILSRRFSLLPLEMFHEFTAYLHTGLAAAMALVLVTIALGVNCLTHWNIGRRVR